MACRPGTVAEPRRRSPWLVLEAGYHPVHIEVFERGQSNLSSNCLSMVDHTSRISDLCPNQQQLTDKGRLLSVPDELIADQSYVGSGLDALPFESN